MSPTTDVPRGGVDVEARRRDVVAESRRIAVEHGLGVVDPVVLYDLFSIVVRLQPHPVVLRVPTVLPALFAEDLDRRARRQADELAAASWLVEHGFPTIAPSPLLPQRPLRSGQWSATAWTYVEHLDAADSAELNDQILPLTLRLHDLLAQYPAPLPFMSFWDETIPAMLNDLHGRPDLLAPADLDRARREHARLDEVLSSEERFLARFPQARVQAIHGDAPFFNVARTTDGVLLTDFELVTRGPLEWDLTLAGDAMHAAYSDLAQRAGRPRLDVEVMAALEAARLLQVVALLALDDQSPGLAAAMSPALEMWRARPAYS